MCTCSPEPQSLSLGIVSILRKESQLPVEIQYTFPNKLFSLSLKKLFPVCGWATEPDREGNIGFWKIHLDTHFLWEGCNKSFTCQDPSLASILQCPLPPVPPAVLFFLVHLHSPAGAGLGNGSWPPACLSLFRLPCLVPLLMPSVLHGKSFQSGMTMER